MGTLLKVGDNVRVKFDPHVTDYICGGKCYREIQRSDGENIFNNIGNRKDKSVYAQIS